MSKKNEKPLPSEWSHLVAADTIENKPVKMMLSPNEAERAKLIQRLGIIGLDGFEAKLSLARDADDRIVHVTGEMGGTVLQNCVVTLEPVKTNIHETFEAWFADPEQAVSLTKAKRDLEVRKGHRELPIIEESEDPEAIIDGQIDVGELVTQYLSLAINPYPHAEGVDYQQLEEAKGAQEDIEIRKNPFAALKDWKDKLK